MSPPDHYELSLRCRRRVEQVLDQNDLLTATEMMWGAVVHAIKHIAPRYIQASLNSHRQIKQVVPVIDAQVRNVNLRRLLGECGVLHRYFYRLHLAEHLVRNSLRQCQRMFDALFA